MIKHSNVANDVNEVFVTTYLHLLINIYVHTKGTQNTSTAVPYDCRLNT